MPVKFHGQRSLAGYSPWGHEEWDTTEHAQASTGVLLAGVGLGPARKVGIPVGKKMSWRWVDGQKAFTQDLCWCVIQQGLVLLSPSPT